MRKVLFTLILSLQALALLAVPADRSPRNVRLTDGSLVTVYLIGDEHYSWLQTSDGIIVEEVSPGLYEKTSRTVEEEVKQATARRRQAARLAPRYIGSRETAPLPSTGSPRVPVVLVNFADSVFTVADTDEGVRHYYDLYCNGTRDGELYTGHGSYGSIRDYFSDQSYGQFTPEFTILGPVTVSREVAYYGQKSGSTKDKNYNTFVREAIDSVSRKFEVDWSLFDNKGAGKVDMVFIIFAGCGENTSKNIDHIWPNERSIGTVNLSNGQSVTFVCSGCCSEKAMRTRKVEEVNVEYTTPDGIGVMCHELSHALGLPDLYDTNYRAYGMDVWSLMDYGCYVNNSKVPCAYTAYERDFMGWKPLVPLTSSGTYLLNPIAGGGQGYKIINDENENEYYVIENRQRTGWDTGLGRYAHGLQVTHVDYDRSSWNGNYVNSIANHQRMTVISANNTYFGSTALQNGLCTSNEMLASWAGTLYPYVVDGVIHNDSLTAHSTPAATVYTSGGFMNKDLHEIRENSDLSMSFYFGNDFIDAINALSLEQKQSEGRLYDLSGRAVDVTQPLRPGIYIQNGRKRLVK